MTPSKLKKAFSQNPNPYQFPKLEITKKSQIYSTFLTSRHHLSRYPILSDSKFHLNPGQKLLILGYNKNEIIVSTIRHPVSRSPQIFTIFNSYIKGFTKVIQ
jgi:hypothetical protein